jgi:hypothetical protein
MRKLRDRAVRAMLLLVTAASSGQPIPDIRDSIEPLALPEKTHSWIFFLSAAALLILSIAIWLVRRPRSGLRPHAIESAEARAYRRLAAIERSSPRALYTELHNIFVEYLERRVVADASRCTTPELLDVLENTAAIQAAWRTSIKAFLASCDRAKFSPFVLQCEPDEAVAECRGLIDKFATLAAFAMVKGVRRELV